MTTRMDFHRFLLRASGLAPDGLIVLARRWLANNWTIGVARTIVFSALIGHYRVTDEEAAALAQVFADEGEDAAAIARLPRATDGEPPDHRVIARLDDQDDVDAIDQAAIDAISVADGGEGVWRAWRIPGPDATFPEPKRIFLVQTAGDPVALAAAVQQLLYAVGEQHPLIEVFDRPEMLPEHTRRALGCAELLWGRPLAHPVRLAAAFDNCESDGTPSFALDRPELDRPEATWVADYLDAGVPVWSSPDLAPDVLRPGQPRLVPTGLRSDGRWVWSDADTYYLNTHDVAPDPELLMSIRAAGYLPPEVGAVALHQIRAGLLAELDPAVDPRRWRSLMAACSRICWSST